VIVFKTIKTLQTYLNNQKGGGKSIGFVPTMGALHDGHAHLFSRSVSEQQRTVVSVFVNPLQFNNPADLEAYPRQLQRDIAIAESQNVDVMFTPSHEEMYPVGFSSTVSAGAIADHMEGLHRPGHFDGVATVVLKLLNAVSPTSHISAKKIFNKSLLFERLYAI
jgi:pantoate--beta-alanine ligase